MSLDELFGPNAPAQGRISNAEKLYRPKSLQALDEKSASFLKGYMESVTGLLLPVVVHSHCVILWLVDQAGTILFALEELVEEQTGELVAVRPRGNWGNIAGTIKLGHPSLLDAEDKHARIGGEISFNRTTSQWEITNRSGRYGTRSHQTLHHLQAATEKFKLYGIELIPSFS